MITISRRHNKLFFKFSNIGEREGVLGLMQCPHPAAYHMKKRHRHLEESWDGMVKFYRQVGRSDVYWSYAGFLPKVEEFLNANGVEYGLDDDLEELTAPAFEQLLLPDPETRKQITLDGSQIKACEALLNGRVCAIEFGTGSGKCLGKGTPVMMFDGSIKAVEEVCEGDLLMGDDSTPRRVLSTCRGVEPLFRIDQKNGDPYVVNQSHILSLHRTRIRSTETADALSAQVHDIPITDYIALSKKQKHLLKGYKVPVRFKKQRKLPFDPYLLGLWLGDGCYRDLRFYIHKDEQAIADYLSRFAADNGLELGIEPDKRGEAMIEYTLRLWIGSRSTGNFPEHPVKRAFRKLNLFGNKHVPAIFKYAGMRDRLRLLAGFIDADCEKGANVFHTSHRHGRIVDDIMFVARSVGLRVTNRPVWKTCKATGFYGSYAGVTISGHTDRVPTLLPHKQCTPRRQKKDPLRCGIKVTPIGDGEYFGFQLDGNRRFLLGDFTVTHNTECAGNAILCCLRDAPERVLMIVPKLNLLYQTKERFEKRTGLSIGIVGDGRYDVDHDIVVATADTACGAAHLKRSGEIQEWLKTITVLVFDEAHHTTSDKWMSILELCPARRVWGLSGKVTYTTAKNQDKQMALEGIFGPPAYRGHSAERTCPVEVVVHRHPYWAGKFENEGLQGGLSDLLPVLYRPDGSSTWLEGCWRGPNEDGKVPKFMLVKNPKTDKWTVDKTMYGIYDREDPTLKIDPQPESANVIYWTRHDIGIMAFDERNVWAAKLANHLRMQREPFLITVKRRKHLARMMTRLKQAGCGDVAALGGHLTGNQQVETLKKLSDGELCGIVAIASTVAEGVDVPSLQHVIKLDGLCEEQFLEQLAGRVRRLTSGKKRGVLHVPRDEQLKALEKTAASAVQYYRKSGLTIKNHYYLSADQEEFTF